jgi:hypothetical protein|tara:strand:+ start:4605 stop:5735 length:1131 start_codon:yes stop_codon:yes gene_type:complete
MILHNIYKIISNPKIFVYTVLWLMVLVFFGTIAQKDIGLYASQMKYFSTYYFILFDYIPLPGGRLTLIIMTVNLASSLFKKNLWKMKKVGVIILHIGGLLLLVGGGVTAQFSSEGNMVINEGENVDFVDDYHRMELCLVNISLEDSLEYIVFDDELLSEGQIINYERLGVKIEIISRIENTRIQNRVTLGDSIYKGFLKEFVLLPKEPDKENTQNRPSIIFRVRGSDNNSDGIYGLFLGQRDLDIFDFKENQYFTEFRRERSYLPFSIELLDFKKVLHPGTNVAKSFSSEINLIESKVPRRVLIQMNEPLRHQGYTFFQASFIEELDGEATVLAVVKNYGRLFPYISSIIMSIGLLVHLMVNLPKMIKKKPIQISE